MQFLKSLTVIALLKFMKLTLVLYFIEFTPHIMKLNTEHRIPTIEEYNFLRNLAGWPLAENHLVEKGLSNSLFAVCVLNEVNSIIGMGRIVGDNALYFHLQDIIVHPDFQKQGIGKIIMNALLFYIDNAGGTNTNIGLMSSKGREKFYKDFGFIERPNEKFGAGMIKIK